MNGYEKQVKKFSANTAGNSVRHGKGSHDYWGNGSLSVTVNHNCKSRHTANSIMKDAGIKHKF